jgi:hypothetical protein
LRRNFVSHEPNLQPEDGGYYYGAARFTAGQAAGRSGFY